MISVSNTPWFSILTALLRPVVRLCLRHRISYGEVAGALRALMVDEAGRELSRVGHEANVSRISVLTGIQRREVKKALESEQPKRRPINLLTRLIGQWQTHPDFSDSKGRARTLTCEGADSEFAELVRSVTGDVNAYTALFALQEAGIVSKSDSKVHLKKKVYVPDGAVAEGFEMYSEDAETLLRAVEENMLGTPTVPNLHVTTMYNNVCKKDVAEIRAWLLDQGTSLHEAARAYLGARDKDSNPRLFKEEGGVQVTLCAFSRVEDSGDVK